MKSQSIEDALRSHGEVIARVEPDPQSVRIAVARAGYRRPQPDSRRRPLGAFATGFACLLLGAAVASAATGVLGSALDSFFGGGTPPGRQLSGAEVPSWLQPAPGYNAPNEVSVVASAGEEHLYAYRQGTNICFGYGHHVSECWDPADWRRELEAQPLFVRGPIGKSIWFGLVSADVASVRVDYASGEPTDIPITNSGFVAPLDLARDPRRIVGFDTSGDEVAEQPIAISP